MLVLLSTFVLSIQLNLSFELVFRKALFNITSILTGTGYASHKLYVMGGFLVSLLFFVGLIGGVLDQQLVLLKFLGTKLYLRQ